MKNIVFISLLFYYFPTNVFAQKKSNSKDKKAIYSLIDQYSLARENQDTVLLKTILTENIDQLVSNGEWRYGKNDATKGMMQSSATNSGNRMLTVEKLRFISKTAAITDCRYEIKNSDGTFRKMWSTFILVKEKDIWKITAIRNMLPAKS